MSLAQCTEDVANSCWAWNCNARHCCAKRRALRCGIGCANATAPVRRRTRFAVMAPTLVHFCTKFAEKKEGLARQKRLERHYRWVARVPVRAARFANATDMAATARAAAPHPAAANVPSHTKTHSRSHSLLQSRASGTVRPCGRRRRAQQQQRLHLRICKMH